MATNLPCVMAMVLHLLLQSGGTMASSSQHSITIRDSTTIEQPTSALLTTQTTVINTHNRDFTSTEVLPSNTHTSIIAHVTSTTEIMRNHINTTTTPSSSSLVTLTIPVTVSSAYIQSIVLSISHTQSVSLSTSHTRSVSLSTSPTRSVSLSASPTLSVSLFTSRTQSFLLSTSRTQSVLMSTSGEVTTRVMSATNTSSSINKTSTQTEPLGSSPHSIPTSVPTSGSHTLDYKLILYIGPPLFIVVVIVILIALVLCINRLKRVRRYRQHLLPLQEMEGSDDSDNEEEPQENREDKEAAFTITYPDQQKDKNKNQRPILAFHDDH